MEREWRQLLKLAVRIRRSPNAAELREKYRRTFTGIYSRLMTRPLEELEAELPPGWK
ncbi:MAG: hypothetical protein IKP40_09440 [Clostridia bacterium]|nr:hypothetical protein [Clostridia bacterium]